MLIVPGHPQNTFEEKAFLSIMTTIGILVDQSSPINQNQRRKRRRRREKTETICLPSRSIYRNLDIRIHTDRNLFLIHLSRTLRLCGLSLPLSLSLSQYINKPY